jgi:hypothetical protein
MSKTNDNSKLNHRKLTDAELDTVSGGRVPVNIPVKVPAKVTIPDLKLA